MKVNMTPNPLDVVTIHASQGDSEARQWEFELHNNGELIDTSDVTEQMFFKAYKGGTEQLLPENGSTPTTSPFIGDIRYPQGLLTDQEFTYRQSPTEEDGLAKIKSIKGNTLVWNQLVDTNTTSVTLTSGHKFITKVGGTYSLVNGTGQSISVTGGTDEVFDLSLMFGTGNEPATVDDFTSLFPLSYYSYNQGSLLSFNGNGIKTVGKNLLEFDDDWESKTSNGVTLTNNHDGTITANGTATATAIPFYNLADVSLTSSTQNDNKKHLQNGTYKVIGFPSGARLQLCESNVSDVSATEATRLNNGDVFTVTNAYKYNWFRINIANGSSFNNALISPMIIFEGEDETFEPYTSSTLSLPISTYFPNGMKSAGNVYDELTETKAITRIGSRAYQSGDESDTSVITDGTTTYYALATPTETSFTTASLVTENTEIPLSNEDGVLIGKCTEELSENPGFIDAKIKLSDSDGECYSNKLQLHVERSPQ